MTERFLQLSAEAGLPRIRLHDVRHTYATISLQAGIPVKIISDRLGHHSSAFTADRYIDAVPELEEAAAEQVAELLFGTDG